MNLPDSIWSARLPDGTLLGERVKHKAPPLMPLKDKQAFLNVWNVRLSDAQGRKDRPMENEIKKLLSFIKKHSAEELSMLIWTETKTSAIFAHTTEEIFILHCK